MTTFVLQPANGRERMAAVWRFACQFLEVGWRAVAGRWESEK